MRGKRSKQYRKLMQQYCLTFGFREPYQVLGLFKFFIIVLENTDNHFRSGCANDSRRRSFQDGSHWRSGTCSPRKSETSYARTQISCAPKFPIVMANFSCSPTLVITQCSIRHLYTLPFISQPQKDSLIAIAKAMERRRCNHHTLDTPLTTLECLSSVIDSKNSKTNKNRYVVASQEEEVRRYCRGVKGVPLVYVKRSVMVMEPMAEGSMSVKEGLERGKFRTGLRGKGQIASIKRKRYDDASDAEAENAEKDTLAYSATQQDGMKPPKEKKVRGPKGPNPLSMKKSQRGSEKGIEGTQRSLANADGGKTDTPTVNTVDVIELPADELQKPLAKRKRKRKHKPTLLAEFEDKGEDSEVRN